MLTQRWTSSSSEATEVFGRALALQLPPRVVVTLTGALGSGKTTLIRGLVSAVSSAPVSSPTFVYHQRYQASSKRLAAGSPAHGIIDHVDLYRVHADSGLRARTGIDELLAAVPGWLLIEWPLIDLRFPTDVPRLAIEASGPPEFRFALVSSWPLSLPEGDVQ